jgi:glycolate oxidase iron-sulfur subunit
MLSCIRCGLCLSVCPTYQLTFLEAEGPRGRVAMARAFHEGRLAVTPDFVEHELNCLLCEACTNVCPAGVRMEELGVALRAELEAATTHPAPVRLLRWLVFRQLFPRPSLFRAFARALRLYQRSGVQALLRRTGLIRRLPLGEAEQFLPPIDREFLVPRGQRFRPSGEPRARVALFAGCVMSTAFAEIDRATIRVLVRNGCEVVVVPDQICCGALNAHSGDREGARRMARRNVEAFETEDAIVVNAAGCAAALPEYPPLRGDDPDWRERAERFAARVRDVTQFLISLGLDRDFGRPQVPVEETVTYQEPCHLAHAQRITQPPREILRAIPGITLVEMRESAMCCGSAGIYNLTNPEMSRGLATRKLDNATATGATTIVTANPGCQIQLQAGRARRGSKVRVRHVVERLDDAYRRAGDGPTAAEAGGARRSAASGV